MTDDTRKSAQDQQATRQDKEKQVKPRPSDANDHPIRIHDPDIENVVGLGYD